MFSYTIGLKRSNTYTGRRKRADQPVALSSAAKQAPLIRRRPRRIDDFNIFKNFFVNFQVLQQNKNFENLSAIVVSVNPARD